MGPRVEPMGPNWAPRDGILFWGGVGLTWDGFLHIGLEGLLLCFTYLPFPSVQQHGPIFPFRRTPTRPVRGHLHSDGPRLESCDRTELAELAELAESAAQLAC